MGQFLKELVKKIELQSILVLFLTLLSGCFLLNKDNSLSTPAGILGSISIGFGILYTVLSFSANQIKESYQDVINHYKTIISTQSSSLKASEERYITTVSNQPKEIGNYRKFKGSQIKTETD